MIHRVVLFFILPMCFIAFFLALLGVQQIEFGDTYYNFLQSVNNSFNSWKFEIPNIPSIDKIDTSSYDSKGLILQVIIKIANFFVSFINIITKIINVLSSIINIFIAVIQFILTLIYQCKDFIEQFRTNLFACY